MTLRNEQRVTILQPVTVTRNQQVHPAVLIDLSLTGARLEMDSPPKIGSLVQFAWLPTLSSSGALQGRIQWRDRTTVGLRLQKVTTLQKYLLKALVNFHRGQDSLKSP